MTEKKSKYLNKAQQEAAAIAAHTEIDICGRRFGKSFGIVSLRIMRNVQYMPGSTGCFVASSYKQAHQRTLPAALSGLAEFGWIDGIHYVVGKRPPAKLGYGKPIVPLQHYDDVVSFYNGAQMVIVSQDVRMSSNSMTFDWVVGDEAKGLDYDKLKDETFPANGGTRRYFSQCPWHHSILFVSDMPVLKSGRWLLNYREKATPEVIATIKGLLYQRWQVAQWPDSQNKNDELGRLDSLLSQLRRIAVLYREWSTFENVDVVGLEYIRQMKRDLPPLVFQTSILSKRIERLRDGFYPNFRENLHTYISNNNTPLQDAGLLAVPEHQDYGCLLDGDLNLNAPISIAFDFNANINWLVAGQRDGMRLKVINSFYVKYERKLRELVDDFCHYYRSHHTKEVVFYYDSTALGSNYAVSQEDFHSVICSQFNKHGWHVEDAFIGRPLKHTEKYTMIDQGFTGASGLLPVFNKEHNEALLIAISLAEVKVTPGQGWHKHKGGEKLMETEDDLLEHRTDGTDAFDTLYIGNCLYPYSSGGLGIGSSI